MKLSKKTADVFELQQHLEQAEETLQTQYQQLTEAKCLCCEKDKLIAKLETHVKVLTSLISNNCLLSVCVVRKPSL